MEAYQIGLSSETLAILEAMNVQRDKMRALTANRVDDRRIKAEAIEFEDRRKGPRRWAERREVELREDSEKE